MGKFERKRTLWLFFFFFCFFFIIIDINGMGANDHNVFKRFRILLNTH